MSAYEVRPFSDWTQNNPYVGRGIVAGKTPDGKRAVSAYFIMGRSENSRNRVFELRDGEVYTKAFDESKLTDPSLIIYAALRELDHCLVVTNGDQTDTVVEYLKKGQSFEQALESRAFEPDAPNFTPRISCIFNMDAADFRYKLSILKSEDAEGSACARYVYSYQPLDGLGHFIHTYEGDGNPLPSFAGEPKRVNIPDSIDELTSEIWNSLNADNRISLSVRYTELESGKYEERLINKNK